MKLKPIINSLLETDMYKFSMGQVIYHQFSDYTTTWDFKCRNEDVIFTDEMIKEIKEQIEHYCTLRFTEEELDYLKSISWIKSSYIDFLRLWHPRRDDIIVVRGIDDKLGIQAKGTWLNTSMYEIPILAIVNEVYFRMNYNYEELLDSFKTKLDEKLQALNSFKYRLSNFSEFGLRRRLSAEAQELVVKAFSNPSNTFCKDTNFVGTSNVYLAKKYGVKPIGTMAHELLMCIGQGDHKHNPAYSNYYTMKAWVEEYGVQNGIVLTDTITTDCFLKDFDLTYATLFNGVRHDSGNPIDWGEKLIKHYEKLGIDTRTKTLLFSDSLNFEKANEIYTHFKNRINVAFGIGTYLSNDTCVKPLNIVMKVTECNGQPVAKISDTQGKGMCKDQNYVEYLQRTIDWRLNNEA